MSEKDDLVRSVVLVVVFLLLTPIAIISSLFTLYSITQASARGEALASETGRHDYVLAASTGPQIYGNLPEGLPNISGEAEAADARIEIVRQYLERYDSPMSDMANVLVEQADAYNLDFRLTTAIAQQESNLCKKIPENTFNCWGWGIHSQGTLGFESFEQGIEIVSRGIKQKYIDEGLRTPEDIMSKYTPQSNGSWANGVTTFIQDMQ